MDSYNVDDVKVEKANAISVFRRVQRMTTWFRFVEVMVVFLFILSRFYTQFASSLKMSGEYIRGISATLTSTRFVFILGNVIVIALYVISGKYPAKNEETNCDVYEEYMEKCQINQPPFPEEEKEAVDAYTCSVPCEEKKVISRSQSGKLERPPPVQAVGPRRKFRRCKSENSRRSVVFGKKEAAGDGASASAAVPSYSEDDMTSEEFRRTVEAFIARQQRVLREEEFQLWSRSET